MSAAELTRPANEIPEAELVARQKALTIELYNHPDPNVRLIAHMSERQLGMMEILMATRTTVSALVTSVDDLTKAVREVTGRQETFEKNYNNGNGSQLDLPLQSQ